MELHVRYTPLESKVGGYAISINSEKWRCESNDMQGSKQRQYSIHDSPSKETKSHHTFELFIENVSRSHQEYNRHGIQG